MTNSIGESIAMMQPAYPHIWESRDRIQIRVGEKRFMVLIRHPVHGIWNGYAMVPKHVWDVIRNNPVSFVPFVCDYEGPGSNIIGWADMRREGTGMMKLTSMDEADFWIGFSLYHAISAKEREKLDTARNMLEELESCIWEARVAYSLT